MQKPQLVLVRVQSNPEDVNFGATHARSEIKRTETNPHTPARKALNKFLTEPNARRLASQPEGFAAVADEAGLLRYVSLHNSSFKTDSVYRLQYGSELVYRDNEPVELPSMIDCPWTSFEFVPDKARAILFHQAGSKNLLHTTLPDALTPFSPALLFGSHTGPTQPLVNQTIRCFCMVLSGLA